MCTDTGTAFSINYCVSDEEARHHDAHAHFAVDWDWRFKRQWAQSVQEGLGTRWETEKGLDKEAYLALIQHFGLERWKEEFPVEKVITMSPDDLFKVKGRIESSPADKITINFGRSAYVRARKDPMSIPSATIEVPVFKALSCSIGESSFCCVGVRLKVSDCDEIISGGTVFWIEARHEWIAVMREAWNECGWEDESFDGPFAINESCSKEIHQAFNLPEGKFTLEEIRYMSPQFLQQVAQ